MAYLKNKTCVSFGDLDNFKCWILNGHLKTESVIKRIKKYYPEFRGLVKINRCQYYSHRPSYVNAIIENVML